ncbi:MAG: helix-turn-helix domain-containing protein [Hyphomicrobiales bacterium]
MRAVQPFLATTIPAIAWLSLRYATASRIAVTEISFHLCGPIIAVLLLLRNPVWLDGLIPILFAGYGTAMIFALAQGEESLPKSRLEHGGMSVLLWRTLSIALILSALSDVFIAFRLASGDNSVLIWTPSLFSSSILFVLGTIGLSSFTEIEASHIQGITPIQDDEEEERDRDIANKLDIYIKASQAYLDPDLTLARLTRKLTVPQKHLSAAINRLKGENVSRFINRHRINHACELVANGRSVTEAMLASGFNVKSNFNRDFLRVLGTNPSGWRKTNLGIS